MFDTLKFLMNNIPKNLIRDKRMKENGIKYFTIANYGRDWKSLLERDNGCV